MIRTERIGPTPRIAVDHSGTGEAVVFLHGIGGNRTNWSEQVGVFSQEFHVIAWDMRGYGESDDYEGPASFVDFTDDLRRVLDHFGIARAHLAGLSLGGRVVQQFYAAFPERCSSLALIDTRPNTKTTRTTEERQRFLDLRAKPLEEGGSVRDIAPAVARSLMGPKATEGVYRRLVESICALHRDSYVKTLVANLDDPCVGDLSAIAVPTIVIVGADDTLIAPAVQRAMAAEIPGAEIVEIPGAGHLSNIENPEAFNEALLGFLRRVRGAEAPARTVENPS